MGVRFLPGAYGGYGVMAAQQVVDLFEAVRVCLATPEKLFLFFQVYLESDLFFFAENFERDIVADFFVF